MKLRFAGVEPYSTGRSPTKEDREKQIEQLTPRSFTGIQRNRIGENGAVVIMRNEPEPPSLSDVVRWMIASLKGDERTILIMRRKVSGYEWRLYLIADISQLFSETASADHALAQAEGFQVSVLRMVTRLQHGDSISYAIEGPYETYVRYASLGYYDMKSWLEKQAVRSQVY